MLNLTGKEIGNQYLKETKASLVNCNDYELGNGDVIGRLFTGFYHSGKKYFAINYKGETYTIRTIRKSLFKNHYHIFQVKDDKSVGYFEYSNWQWMDKTQGKLIFTTGQVYNFKEAWSILWQSPYTLELASETCSIKYIGEFKIGKHFEVVLTGRVTIEGRTECFDAVIGLFLIDRKFRSWVRRNVD